MKFGKKEAFLAAGLATAVPGMAENAPELNINPDHTTEVSKNVSDKVDNTAYPFGKLEVDEYGFDSKKDKKIEGGHGNPEAHKMDSLVMKMIGANAIYFGAEDADSLAKANGVKAKMNYKINFEDLKKKLSSPSVIEGKTIGQALADGDYIAYFVPNEIEGEKVDYDNILKLFNVKKIKGENVGDQKDVAQSIPVTGGLHLAPVKPFAVGEDFPTQQALKGRNHQIADYNETLFMLLAKKVLGKNRAEKMLGRVLQMSKSPGQGMVVTLSNKYVIAVDEGGEISINGWDNGIEETNLGLYVDVVVGSKRQ